MRSIFEFALIAWVIISVVAVTVQLIRIARYKRASGAAPAPATEAARPEAPTINLAERLATTPTADANAGTSTAGTSNAMASAATAEHSAASTATSAPSPEAARLKATPAPAPVAATSASPSAAPIAPTNVPSTPPAQAPTSAVPAPTTTAASEAGATATPDAVAPTLADLLAGVRLPWNLLPTVDQGREPSNDRVALITSEGDPGDIGVDVADELERLGFVLAPRGDDTAVATRGKHSLGLQIIEDPMTAEIDGTRRFPAATESSVALDIWIET